MQRIGFVGLGRMGFPVAARLAAAGYHVQATDIRSDLAGRAASAGLAWRPTAAAAAEQVEVLLTMLPGPLECRAALLGDDGALAGLAPGAVWIDLTSSSPQIGAEISAVASDFGVRTLEAPVGGDPAAASAGTLTLFAGGDAHLLELQRPLLADFADRVWYCGAAGAGYLTKLVINQLWFGQAVATAEMMLLAGRMGLNLSGLQQILAHSAASSAFVESYLPALMEGDYLCSFPVDRVVEELETVSALARAHAVPATVGDAVLAIHRAAQQRFGPADGELLGVALLEEDAGLSIRSDPR